VASNIKTLDGYTAGLVRNDVSPTLYRTLFENPSLAIFPFSTEPSQGDETREHSWFEEQLAEPYAILENSFTDTGAGGVAVVSAATVGNLAVGMLVHIDGHLDSAFKKVVHRITVIAGQNVTLVRVQGLQTNYTVDVTGNNRIHFSNSIRDNSVPGDSKGVDEPTRIVNYMQTLEEVYELGHMAQNLSLAELHEGMLNEDALTRLRIQAMVRLVHKIDNAIWSSAGQAYAASPQQAFMKSVDSFVNTTAGGTQVNGEGEVLSTDMVNTMARALYRNGLPMGTTMMMVASPEVIDHVGGLRENLTEYDDFVPNMEFGGSVRLLHTTFGGYRFVLVPHPKFTATTPIYCLSQGNVELVPPRSPRRDSKAMTAPTIPGIPNGWAWMVDAAANGQHGIKEAILCEMSLKVKQAAFWHGTIVNYSLEAEESA
jgi:hypothetical protein